jgi:hypothetical protein
MVGSYWREHHIENYPFPEGQLVILVDGKVVGSALSLIVDESLVDKNHNSDTGNIPFDPQSKKDVLYGIDIFIHPITVDCVAVDCMMLEKLCEQTSKPLFRKDP